MWDGLCRGSRKTRSLLRGSSLDMGIALGSAVKIAGLMNVDNRIMYRIGVVAREMKLVDADFVMGIPLSATGKSIYFDRS